MKKILFLLALFALVISPMMALAYDVIPPVAQPTAVQEIPNTNFENTIDGLTNWFFAILLIVAVWFFIWAGFNFVTANGESDKISQARNQLTYGIIGVLVAVLAKGLVGFAMGLAAPN